MPLKLELLIIMLSCQFNAPKRLWNEFLDLFSLIDAKAKSRCLAWTVRDCNLIARPILASTSATSAATSTTTSASTRATTSITSQALLQGHSLEASEGDTNLQI